MEQPRIDLRNCGTPHVLHRSLIYDALSLGTLTLVSHISCLSNILCCRPLYIASMINAQRPIQVKEEGAAHGVDNSSQEPSQNNRNVAPSAEAPQGGGVSAPLKLAPEVHTSKANTNNFLKEVEQSKDTDRYDPNFTQNVISATGPKASPRMRTVVSSLIRHIHDFAREVDLTVDEWMAGVEMVCSALPCKEASGH